MVGPLLVGYAVGRHVLRMNPALLLGAMTGALTSTAALKQVNSLAKSSAPMLGYVGTYTFANVMLTVAGVVLVLQLFDINFNLVSLVAMILVAVMAASMSTQGA